MFSAPLLFARHLGRPARFHYLFARHERRLVSGSDSAYPAFMSTPRLTPEKWLTAGFDALQARGAQALAAEPLARQLGTTKGSFYWHFKDVPSFQDALLEQWQVLALKYLEEKATQIEEPALKLRRFGRDIINDRNETAVRIWAQSEPRAARVIAIVDAARHQHLVALLSQIALGNPDFARALQAALVGLPQISADSVTDRSAPFDTLVDTVLALAEV